MYRITLLALLALFSLSVLAHDRVVNVFYSAKYEDFAVNTEKDNRSGFLRTKKFTLISSRINGCALGCAATMKSLNYSSFSIIVNGKEAATVFPNDPDNLLPSKGFSVNRSNGKMHLVMDLNKLENAERVLIKF